MELFKATLTGKALMQHNVRLANPFDSYARELAKLNKDKKAKGADKDKIMEDMARVEWEGGLYYDNHLQGSNKPYDIGDGPIVPSAGVRACLIAGAKLSRGGRDVQRGVNWTKTHFKLKYKGPRDVQGLWDAGVYTDQRIVRVGQAKVLRTRPVFPNWSTDIEFLFDDAVINHTDILRFLTQGGSYEGLYEARNLGYGRFSVSNVSIETYKPKAA